MLREDEWFSLEVDAVSGFAVIFFFKEIFFLPVWRATGFLGTKWAKRWMAEEKEQSSGWERNHFRSIVDERAEQAAGQPGATPVFMIFKGGWHACTRNRKTLIVTETYSQAAFLLLHRQALTFPEILPQWWQAFGRMKFFLRYIWLAN